MSDIIPKTESLIGRRYAEAVLEMVNASMQSIDVLMFEWRWYENDFSHPIQIINHAIVRAVRRGVKVRALTWKSDIAERLRNVGVDAKAWPMKKLMHSKLLIFDRHAVVMGSHNLTGSAINTNIENSILIYDMEIAKVKTDYFDTLWSQ